MGHGGTLQPHHPNYNGSIYNTMREWENWDISSKPLLLISADIRVKCTIYAKEHNMLNKPGFQSFKCLAKHENKLLYLQNQAKLRSYCASPKCEFSCEMHKNKIHDHAF